MSHQVIKKALKMKRLLNQLAREKENTIRAIAGLPPVMSWWSKCCMGISSSIRECLCRAFCPCCLDIPSFSDLCCPKYSFRYRLCTDGEYPNVLVKSFLGFIFGSLLAMAIFFFLCLQIEANMTLALTLSIGMGSLLSLGMAFSPAVRCLVFLGLPTTCSSKGRSFLMFYAMVLIMNHPVHNFSNNLNVLTDAATCGQSLALNETKKMAEAAASPLMSVIGGIKSMLASIRRFADDLRNAFKALLRAVEEVLDIMANAFKWLGSITDVCNEKMGQPYRKCKKVFEDGYDRCSSALGIMDFVCEVVSLVGKVCYLARIGELLCLIADAIKDVVLDVIGPPIKSRIDDVKKMFYFNVSINYHFHYSMNQSQSYSNIRRAILGDIRAKLSIFDVIQTVIDNVMPLTVGLVVVKAVLYRRGYLNKDKYDNIYITRHLYLIDDRRKEMDKESIFPLRNKEQIKFIPTFSLMLSKKEAKKMIKGLMFWSFGAFHAGYYILCDYGLYWILSLIRKHMNIRTTADIPPHLRLHVKGQGPMSDMFKAMVGVLEPVSDSGFDIDPTACLPNPSEPSWEAYKIIGSIFTICFFLTMFEAYGLRLRHAVAACYYPHRERARAVWLYNHILQMRESFLLFTRRQLHRKRKDGKGLEKLSIRSRLLAQFPILKPIFQFFGYKERKRCMSCSTEGGAADVENFSHCDNCNTAYCNDCFADLGNVCTYCMAPVDYGDVADESVETDSSEDEDEQAFRQARMNAKKTKVAAKKQARRPSVILNAFQKQFGLPESPSKMALLVQQQGDAETGKESRAESDYTSSASTGSSGSDNDSGDYSSSYDSQYQYKKSATSSDSGSDSDEEEEYMKDLRQSRRRSMRTARPSIVKRKEKVSMEVFDRPDESASESDSQG